jgi:glutathione S-transferase
MTGLKSFVILLLIQYSAAFQANFKSRSQSTHSSREQGTSVALKLGIFDELLTRAAPKPKVQVPDDFVVPEPKPLEITSKTDLKDFATNTLALALRLGTGAFTLGWKIDTILFDGGDDKYSLKLGPLSIRDSSSVLTNAPRPEKPLIIYEYDASPYCKRVREMINLLDLTVEYRPCPGARQGNFSDQLFERTGRRTVPYLIDPNTGTELFESNDQIEYMISTYGPPEEDFDRKALWPITFEGFSIYTSTLVAILRNFPGRTKQKNARPDNEEMIPLELWAYESSPFVRPVREKLSSLCLPHVLVSCSRGSANRDRMVEKTGRFQVPFLFDPNTNIEMFEGAEIVEYLEAVYTAK